MRGRGGLRSELLGMAATLALAGAAEAGEAAKVPVGAGTAAVERHFGFTKLVVGDLAKSAAFYESALALVRPRQIDFEGGAEILFEPTAPGGAMFVLIHYDAAPKPASGEVVLGFDTADIEALVASIVAAGGTVDRAPYAIPEMKLKVAFVRDVEGHTIELLERTP